MELDQIIQEIYPLPAPSKEALKKIASLVEFKKGHMLFKAGENNNNVYLVSKGLSRGYVDLDNTDATFGFFGEGKPLLSIQNYVENIAGYENIELLEDCVLYKFRKEDLEQMYMEDIYLSNWGRKLAEKSFVETERLLITRQFKSSLDRYEEFQRDYPELMNRVKLKYIASYLGMTQVNLSRIRAHR
jgi:CRP-like cAMP-binding protein